MNALQVCLCNFVADFLPKKCNFTRGKMAVLHYQFINHDQPYSMLGSICAAATKAHTYLLSHYNSISYTWSDYSPLLDKYCCPQLQLFGIIKNTSVK